MKIAIIEDDEGICELVRYALTASNFEVFCFESGREFFKFYREGSSLPDLLLLDIMLPDISGLQILKDIRGNNRTASLPVIMLTAKGSEYDRIKGLDSGADDYITKPFSILELISRINAVLRRSGGETADSSRDIIKFGEIEVDKLKRTVISCGAEVPLTYKEFELLLYLLENNSIVLSREKILNHVWGFDYSGETRTVDMHIKTLRQKLGNAGEYIKTVRNVGYKISR